MKRLTILIIILTITTLVGCSNKSESFTVTAEWTKLSTEVPDEYKPERTTYWNETTGELVETLNKQIIRSTKIPIGAEYEGYSVCAGYLFLFENELYRIFKEYTKDEKAEMLSSCIIDVIDCNIYINSINFLNFLLIFYYIV